MSELRVRWNAWKFFQSEWNPLCNGKIDMFTIAIASLFSHEVAFFCISTAFKLNLIKHIVDFFLGNYCPEIYVLLPRYRWFSANVTFITFISLCFILQMWSMARSTDLIADLRCDVWSDSSIQLESKIGSCCCLSEIFLAPIQVTEINQFRCVMKRPIFNVLLARTTLK